MLHVFTLTWEGEGKLNKLLPTMIEVEKTMPGQIAWHIRDHGSKDNTLGYLKSQNLSWINAIDYKHNKENYSQGMNWLFENSGAKTSDYCLTLNNDISIQDPNSIKKMIDLLNKSPTIGVVGAKLNYPDGTLQHAGVLFHDNVRLPYHYKAKQKQKQEDCLNRYFPVVTGAVTLTTADLFNELKFDPKFIWCFDDVDFCIRAQAHCKRSVVYCGEAEIFHEESASLKKNPVNTLYKNHNCNLLHQKWMPFIEAAMKLNSKYKEDKNFAVIK